jgi:hypothetical protein
VTSDNKEEAPMKIYFHGAPGDITRSAYHVKTKHASVAFSDSLHSRHGLRPECPNLGDVIEI